MLSGRGRSVPRAQDTIREGFAKAQELLFKAGGRMGSKQGVAELACAAASRNDVDELQTLVRNGADMNTEDWKSRTPLHLAASNGQLEACSWLLSLPGIKLNPLDMHGNTPLEDAHREGHEVLQVLLRKAGGLRAADPSLVEAREAKKRERAAALRRQFLDRANSVVHDCLESSMATGLEATMKRMKKMKEEVRALLYSLLILLRKVAYLQMDVTEAQMLGLDDSSRDTSSLEQRLQDVERLKLTVRSKAQQLLQLLEQPPLADKSLAKVRILRMMTPHLRENAKAARENITALVRGRRCRERHLPRGGGGAQRRRWRLRQVTLVMSVLSPQAKPEHQREVLRRDLRARVRATRTIAARSHAVARRESMGVLRGASQSKLGVPRSSNLRSGSFYRTSQTGSATGATPVAAVAAAPTGFSGWGRDDTEDVDLVPVVGLSSWAGGGESTADRAGSSMKGGSQAAAALALGNFTLR